MEVRIDDWRALPSIGPPSPLTRSSSNVQFWNIWGSNPQYLKVLRASRVILWCLPVVRWESRRFVDTNHIPAPRILGGESQSSISPHFLSQQSAPHTFIFSENLLIFSPTGNTKQRKKENKSFGLMFLCCFCFEGKERNTWTDPGGFSWFNRCFVIIFFSPLYFLSDQTDAMWNIKSNHLVNNLENVGPCCRNFGFLFRFGSEYLPFSFFLRLSYEICDFNMNWLFFAELLGL